MTQAKPSKSARKREHRSLQELGEKLIELKDAQLDSMSLDKDLVAAIRAATRMKSHGALRRQKQLIGKLMQDADAESIRAALLKFSANEHRSRRLFASAERWRDRLVSDGTAALQAFEAQMHLHDAELHQLLSELAITINERTEKTLRRQIFRRIHTILVAQTEDS